MKRVTFPMPALLLPGLLLPALLLALPTLAAAQQVDTTFAVQPGAELRLEMMTGAATVRTWDRREMRVVAHHSRPAQLTVRQRSGSVTVESGRTNSFLGPVGLNVRYEITVPRSFSVRVEGLNVDVNVDGVQGSVAVENMEGAVRLTNITGNVRVESVNGRVAIENVQGDVRVETVNQDLALSGIRGAVRVETVNGGIRMQAMDSRSVQASTVNGAVEYAGTISDGGRYQLGTHNGRIVMAVPERTNATLAITTRVGQVDSAFPVSVTGTRNGQVTVTLGSGSARVELESFNGTVRLVRP